jgi:ribosomal protein L28
MSARKDFHRLMERYNRRFGRNYQSVEFWLRDLNSRLSIRAIARLIRVDRDVLTRKLKEIFNGKDN